MASISKPNIKNYSQWFAGENRAKSEQTGFFSLVNCDVHSELGILSNQLALTTDSATPNEDCISEILTNGDTFFFSTASGKIWKRTNAGVYSLVHTGTQGNNYGCKLWQGYLYYATSTKLGRITEALASSQASWSSQDDSFGTFTNTTVNRPMITIGKGLYIGDGYYIAAVDSTGTLVLNVLDVPKTFTITALGQTSDDLMIGTTIGANVGWCKIFGWNRISPSWTFEDVIPEVSVNCFIQGDNIIFFQAGGVGQIYYWSGSQGVKLKKIKGVTTAINSYNATELAGKSLFAVGSKVYSIHREDSSLPYAVAGEYTAGGTIKSLGASATQIFVSGGSVIAKIGTTYATAVIETPTGDGKYRTVEVSYRSIASGATIGIETSIDDEAYVAQTVKVDEINKKAYFDGGLVNHSALQARITLTGLVNIKSINFNG